MPDSEQHQTRKQEKGNVRVPLVFNRFNTGNRYNYLRIRITGAELRMRGRRRGLGREVV
jgi:hypothetical protein